MLTNYEKVKNFRKLVRICSVAAMGATCQICKYDKCIKALEIHHIDSKEKEFSFNNIISWENTYFELKKCILLCCRCHREVHYDNLEIPNTYFKFDQSIADSMRNKASFQKKGKVNKEERMAIVLNSNIDYSIHGWGSKLGYLIGVSGTNAIRWVRHNMPEFFEKECFDFKANM